MLVILSPAMNLTPTESPHLAPTRPRFHKEAVELVRILRQYDPWQLESLLGLNARLSLKAWEDYRDFDPDAPGTPAVLSFRGLAYRNLQPQDFTSEDVAFADRSLRLLSALYGLLRPGDGILPYRLDFLCRFARRQGDGRGLYRVWGDRVCRALFREERVAVNLCSGEYERLVVPHLTERDRLVTCRFLVWKAGRLRCQATDSKMARGQMARFIIKNRIQSPEELTAFRWGDYAYSPEQSGADRMVFVRP